MEAPSGGERNEAPVCTSTLVTHTQSRIPFANTVIGNELGKKVGLHYILVYFSPFHSPIPRHHHAIRRLQHTLLFDSVANSTSTLSNAIRDAPHVERRLFMLCKRITFWFLPLT